MRTIIMLNRISVDGYFASTNQQSGGMDWFVQDPEVDKAVRKPYGAEADTVILGANTFKMFESFWEPISRDPNASKELKEVAEELSKMNKIVFSKTLKDTNWINTEFHNGNLENFVRNLKNKKGGSILIFGSGTIVQQLANEGLIDVYMFIVSPVIAGVGLQLFKNIQQQGLKLLSVESFASDNVLLRYELGNPNYQYYE